ncbi:hypothetical protein ACFPTY_00940 [Halomonas beimenensis]|uniref:Uncharacterized protein n=1 Tax=Halomonas beimenensis TaxID=475662 RepID=A0A291P3R8_9GAMM|nr:hypothetical protein [Halomonas beimenensis]ATJ81519.1 hypothetical protein BEI_0532 [Halomonas beimenensis]
MPMCQSRSPIPDALVALPLLVFAPPSLAEGGHDLTFTGAGSFNAPHGGQTIQVAVYDVTAGEVVASQSGQVAKEEPQAFAFTFPGVLQEGHLYDIHYWIDSNFGGGSEGVCDPVNIDHQWREALNAITEAVTLHVEHRAEHQAPVCATFAD